MGFLMELDVLMLLTGMFTMGVSTKYAIMVKVSSSVNVVTNGTLAHLILGNSSSIVKRVLARSVLFIVLFHHLLGVDTYYRL